MMVISLYFAWLNHSTFLIFTFLFSDLSIASDVNCSCAFVFVCSFNLELCFGCEMERTNIFLLSLPHSNFSFTVTYLWSRPFSPYHQLLLLLPFLRDPPLLKISSTAHWFSPDFLPVLQILRPGVMFILLCPFCPHPKPFGILPCTMSFNFVSP